MDISNTQIEAAYNDSGLKREGITLDAALASPMFKRCLIRIAENVLIAHHQHRMQAVQATKTAPANWWNTGSMA